MDTIERPDRNVTADLTIAISDLRAAALSMRTLYGPYKHLIPDPITQRIDGLLQQIDGAANKVGSVLQILTEEAK